MDDDFLAVSRHLLNGEGCGGVGQVEDSVDLVDLERFARGGGGNINLVLVIGSEHDDGHAGNGAAGDKQIARDG